MVSTLKLADLRGQLASLGGLWPSQKELEFAWRVQREVLMANARWAELWGYNWRPEKPVRVGGAVLGYCQGEFDSNSLGWNFTPRPLSVAEKVRFKPCAEKFAIIDCLSRGYLPVGMMIFTSHNQPDDETGLHLDVQASCHNCVEWMETLLPPWFRIGSFRPRLVSDPSGPGPFIYAEWTLDNLGLLHQEAHHLKTRCC
jgi:hypothetical protein